MIGFSGNLVSNQAFRNNLAQNSVTFKSRDTSKEFYLETVARDLEKDASNGWEIKATKEAPCGEVTLSRSDDGITMQVRNREIEKSIEVTTNKGNHPVYQLAQKVFNLPGLCKS